MVSQSAKKRGRLSILSETGQNGLERRRRGQRVVENVPKKRMSVNSLDAGWWVLSLILKMPEACGLGGSITITAISQVGHPCPRRWTAGSFQNDDMEPLETVIQSLQWPYMATKAGEPLFLCSCLTWTVPDLLRSRKSTGRKGYESATVYSQPDADMQP